MNIRTHLVYSCIADELVLRSGIAVVIDVLRAGTTICHALHNGAREVIPAAEVEEAIRLASLLDKDQCLLGGERNCVKPEGFHAGNSPFDYDAQTVADKSIVFTSSNGTRALMKTRHADVRLFAGFVNLAAATAFICRHVYDGESSRDIDIVCAGTDLRFSYEDTLCAGALAAELRQHLSDAQPDDASHAAMSLYRQYGSEPADFVLTTEHAARLSALGFENDVRAALRLNSIALVPVFRESSLKAA